MRVIAGSARRLLLKTIEGMDTRPTTDRIKETLFNMLQYEIAGSSFLDLFSGSGAIGIEALSRGARRAVFVEQNPLAVSCIQDNLETTHLKERALIMKKDVLLALKELEGKEEPFGSQPWDGKSARSKHIRRTNTFLQLKENSRCRWQYIQAALTR